MTNTSFNWLQRASRAGGLSEPQIIKIMITTNDLTEARTRITRALTTCDRIIERRTRYKAKGCSPLLGNSIIIDKSRMMTVTIKNRMTTYEFAPLYPTIFTSDVAERIIKRDVFIDGCGYNVDLEIVSEIEYYRLLKDCLARRLDTCEEMIKTQHFGLVHG